MNTPTQYPPQHTEDTIDLRKWFGILLSNWYWFVFSVIVFGSAAYMFTRYMEPVHRVEATLLISDEDKAIGAEALFNEFNFGSASYMDNEIYLLKSWYMANRTLQQLNFQIDFVAVGRWTERHLYDNVPFRVETGQGAEKYAGIPIYVEVISDTTYQLRIYDDINVNVIHSFGKAYSYEDLVFLVQKDPNFNINELPDFLRTNEYYFVINNKEEQAAKYSKNLQVEWIDKNTSILKISLEGPSVKKEADYINTLMDEFIDMGMEEKNQTAKNTVIFIDEQLAEIVDSLRSAEEMLSQFRSEQRVVSLSDQAQSFYTTLEKLGSEKAVIEISLTNYKYLLKSLNEGDNYSELSPPAISDNADPTLLKMFDKLRVLEEQKREYETYATTEYQALKTVITEIQKIVVDMKGVVSNTIEQLNNAFTQAQNRIDKVHREMSVLPETERQHVIMERNLAHTTEIFTFLSQKRAEAAIAEASNIADEKIVDRARVNASEQVAPKTMINYAVGVLLGLFIPFIIIVLKDFMNHKIREKEDVEGNTEVPVIGSVGKNKRDEFLPSLKHPRSSIAESFRAIRTDLQFMMYKNNSKVIMVTSTTAGEGKTFVSMNLGGIFSSTDKKTVVVGLDLRLPLMHKYIKFDNSVGVSTHIIGKNTLEEIIIPGEYPNMFYIPAGPVVPNPAELIQTQEFENFIEELKRRFDIIILDTPPVALVTDASLIAKHSDANLYIVRQNYTHKNAINFIDKFAEKDQVKNLSIIINDVVVPKYYGYKYGYGYGYGYGKGYGSGYYVED